MRKYILMVLSITMLAFLPAKAQNTAKLHQFLAKFSTGYNAKFVGKSVCKFKLSDKINSDVLKGSPVMMVFWSSTVDGEKLIHWTDSIRNLGQIDTKLVCVNINAASESIAEYNKSNKFHFSDFGGVEASKLAKKLEATDATVIFVGCDGKVQARWDHISQRDMLRWAKVTAWVLGNPDAEYTSEAMNMCFKGNDYAKGLYISEQLDWSDEELMEKNWLVRFILLTWNGNTGVLDFAKKAYNKFSIKYQNDPKKYETFLTNLASQMSYTTGPDLNASPEICEYGIQLYEEVKNKYDKYKDSFVVTDRIRTMYGEMGGHKDLCLQLAEKAMAQCKAREAAGMHIHPDTYKYLQRMIDQYK